MEYTYEKVSVGTVLFNEDNRLLFVDRVGNEIISKLSKMLREH
jgi:hypothetical protein